MTAAANGSVSGFLNWNDLSASVPQNPTAFTGSYTVDPTGRVTLTGISDGSTFTYSVHLYLAADGNALALSNDMNDILAGQAFQQSAGVFSGGYGLNAATYLSGASGAQAQSADVAGPLMVTATGGTDEVEGFADDGVGAADFAISGAFTQGAGGVYTGTLSGFNPLARGTAGRFALYLVDSTQGLLIQTDSAQLTLGRLQRAP